MSDAASPAGQMRKLAASVMIGADRSGGADTPGAVLAQAAVAGARYRAGFKPRTVKNSMDERPADPRPVAPAAAMATLARLLGDPDAGLIEEWAGLAQAKGVRVDDATAPVVLDWWARQPMRSEAVFTVLGRGGEWLASLNPAWRKPVAAAGVPSDADEIWQTGKTPDRLTVLMTVRRHDPARAMVLIQSTWDSDGADERRRFLEVLRDGLSMSDEPFLENTLDDKSKVVRRQAASLLTHTPGSRLRQRMNDRVRAIIAVESKRGLVKRAPKLSLNPPTEFAPSWERDGIEEKAGSGVGQRAWWLRQILASADLSVWKDLSGAEPEVVLELLEKDDYFDDALTALIQAASNAKDPAWSAALVRCLAGKEKVDLTVCGSLCRELPLSDAEPLLLELLNHKWCGPADRWSLLASTARPWSTTFSTAALKLATKNAPKKAEEAWTLSGFADAVSRLVSPGAADAFEQAVSAMFPDQPTDSFKRSIDRVRLRADMHKEFAS